MFSDGEYCNNNNKKCGLDLVTEEQQCILFCQFSSLISIKRPLINILAITWSPYYHMKLFLYKQLSQMIWMASDKKSKIQNCEFWVTACRKIGSPILKYTNYKISCPEPCGVHTPQSPCCATCRQSCRKEESVRTGQKAISQVGWSLDKSGLLDSGPAWKELLNRKESEQNPKSIALLTSIRETRSQGKPLSPKLKRQIESYNWITRLEAQKQETL